jgi:hypothetical protein
LCGKPPVARHRSRRAATELPNLRKEMKKRQGNLARRAVEALEKTLENAEPTPALDEKGAHRSRSLKRRARAKVQ